MKIFRNSTWIKWLVGAFFIIIIILLVTTMKQKEENTLNDPLEWIQSSCPQSPNCVSTMLPEVDKHFISPLPFKINFQHSKQVILDILKEDAAIKNIELQEKLIYVQYIIPVFGFVDDVVFYFDQNTKEIHFRSASRIGYWDLGVNRRRMKKITKRYLNWN